jgi:hypothetical protein
VNKKFKVSFQGIVPVENKASMYRRLYQGGSFYFHRGTHRRRQSNAHAIPEFGNKAGSDGTGYPHQRP